MRRREGGGGGWKDGGGEGIRGERCKISLL